MPSELLENDFKTSMTSIKPRFVKRALSDWISLMESLPDDRDELSATELAEFLGIDKSNMLKTFKRLSVPVQTRTVGRQKHSFFNILLLKKISRAYNNGRCWKVIPSK